MLRTLSRTSRRRTTLLAASAAVLATGGALLAGVASASAVHKAAADVRSAPTHRHGGRQGDSGQGQGQGRSGTELTTIFSGATLGISQPDDLTTMGHHLFIVFQNGVGPQGQASASGGLDSTLVELTPLGAVVTTWSIAGHADGLTADPANDRLIATVNEDGNSSLYTIDPSSTTAVQYSYSPSPLPHGGGTDAVSIVDGKILVSASAPSTPPTSAYPAVYSVVLDPSAHTAKVTAMFSDTASATVANAGSTQGQAATLALTDPDSNEVVPWQSPRFGGDFVLDSQGDDEQIYVSHAGEANQTLAVLSLSASVNDTAWATSHSGTLYITDNANNLVDALSGRFQPGTAFVATTPCNDNNAPSTCPATGYPANYLGTLDLGSGTVTPVDLGGELVRPAGLDFVPSQLGGFGQG
ncbi:MAG: putative cell wall binding protein [Acidimicrobiaceae bacterium]|nr:putative cell wall binding protein [Acidimicrobiaceae bacterium]